MYGFIDLVLISFEAEKKSDHVKALVDGIQRARSKQFWLYIIIVKFLMIQHTTLIFRKKSYNIEEIDEVRLEWCKYVSSIVDNPCYN